MKDIVKKVKDRLDWNDEIDPTQIEISLDEGEATLKGCVSTYPEKILAEIEVKMLPEINTVINNIEVIFTNLEEIPSDNEVKEAMFCLLDANSEIDSNDVNVSVEGGNIVLEGKVNSYWKSYNIQKMASQISGVTSITNQISIIPDKKISDEEISNSILTAMQNSVYLDVDNIDIKIHEGIVTLSGILHSKSEYDAALNFVRTTKGVIDINNDLKFILQYNTT
jgi:osmotically-inducible protein OsmY